MSRKFSLWGKGSLKFGLLFAPRCWNWAQGAKQKNRVSSLVFCRFPGKNSSPFISLAREPPVSEHMALFSKDSFHHLILLPKTGIVESPSRSPL